VGRRLAGTHPAGDYKARTRLGPAPMAELFDRAAVLLATSDMKGAWLAHRRLMAIDGTSFDVAWVRPASLGIFRSLR
jgi:hypothetical protein